jgi:type IV pilus assembly protein PilM
MAKKVTTLFIRDTSINLLVMKGNQIEKWASSPLEPGLVSQGLIVDEAQVADKVRQIFKETGAKANRVTIGLSGHDSLYRIITLPELPDAVLPEAIRREAKRTIPTPLEEVYISYQRLPSQTKGESRIFLATFPRNLVDALVRTLRQAGVKAYVMDLAPLALSRIPNESRAIIVNARLDHLDVIVLADRLPQVIRRLALPGEAESLEDRLPVIAEEFNRTVSFYNSSHMERPLDATVPVFVAGDLAEAPDMWPSVVGGAPYKVSALSSPVAVPEGLNTNQFMVNIGLALKKVLTGKDGANSSIVNFNALPEAYVPPRFSILRVIVPVVAVIGIGVIVLVGILILNTRPEVASLRSEVTLAETSVARLRSEISLLTTQIGSAGAIADELNTRVAAMEQGRATTYLDLKEIVKLATGKVTLSSVSYGGSSISMAGTAPNVGLVYSYARGLRSSPRFESWKIWVSPVSGSKGAFSFKFSLTK